MQTEDPDKETGYLIEEIVKLEDTQAALLLLEECAQHNPCFLFEDFQSSCCQQSVCEGHPQQDFQLTCCNTELQGRAVE